MSKQKFITELHDRIENTTGIWHDVLSFYWISNKESFLIMAELDDGTEFLVIALNSTPDEVEWFVGQLNRAL